MDHACERWRESVQSRGRRGGRCDARQRRR
jgi:hypothetical protein